MAPAWWFSPVDIGALLCEGPSPSMQSFARNATMSCAHARSSFEPQNVTLTHRVAALPGSGVPVDQVVQMVAALREHLLISACDATHVAAGGGAAPRRKRKSAKPAAGTDEAPQVRSLHIGCRTPTKRCCVEKPCMPHPPFHNMIRGRQTPYPSSD